MENVSRRAFVAGATVAVVPIGTIVTSYYKTEPIGPGDNHKIVRGHIPPSKGGLRLSTVNGDVGEANLARIMVADKTVKIYLDDVLQEGVVTVDEGRGYIVRWLETKNGIALNYQTGQILYETVYGDVRIEVV